MADAIYVLVNSDNIVVNVVVADATWAASATANYAQILGPYQPTDSYPGIGTNTDPPTISLATYQANFLAQLQLDCQNFILSRYDLPHQTSLSSIGWTGAVAGRTNQAAYCSQVLSWAGTVLELYYTTQAAMNAAASLAAAQAITYDFTQFIATDPLVTIQQAMGITN